MTNLRIQLTVRLTATEEIIARYLAEGMSYKQIGSKLNVKSETVRQHVFRAAMKIPGSTWTASTKLRLYWHGVGQDILDGRKTA